MEIPVWARQGGYGVRFEWGLAGVRALGAERVAAVVVVDVLSFTTSVSVAVEAGTRVYPYPWRDGSADFAAARDARLAVGRRAVSEEQPWSLSPAALRRAVAPERLVLPSPNGSAISAAVEGVPVIAASLRNASAVGRWIAERGWGTSERPVGVIAAGEHWPGQGVLRPAIEDLLGAGAVIDALAERGAGPLSPEASSARLSYAGAADVRALIRDCASGRELASIGFGDDVAIATEVDSSAVVPVLGGGYFSDAAD